MSTYFLHDGRNEIGPFNLEVLKKQKLTRNTPIRQEGKNQWTPAEKIGAWKEQVGPRRLKRPKDIVPVIIERATEFKQRRPKAAYTILLLAALLAGISIYSVGKSKGKSEGRSVSKGVEKSLPEVIIALPVQAPQTMPMVAAVVEKKEAAMAAPKEDKEKAARLRWNKLFTASNSNYGIGLLGGIKDLKVVINNNSDYPVDEAVAKITYIKANGDIWKTKLVVLYGIPAHDSKEQLLPDVSRGKKVTVRLQKVVSKGMKFSYMAGQKVSNAGDPYLMQ